MIRSFWATPSTSECLDEGVTSWRRYMGPAEHVTYDINGSPQDERILAAAKQFRPEVIFFTGGESGAGLPSIDTLKALRKIAPSVHIEGDLADPPWWPRLEHYRQHECFDLQVAQDGVPDCPADYVTVTPIDPEPFAGPSPERDIACGFPGNHVPWERWEKIRAMHGTEDKRSGLLHRLRPLVTLRERDLEGSYRDYAHWMKRCRMVINTSWTGSGLVHHLKGRVIETALAGAALLEMTASPVRHWFPAESYFSFGEATPEEAKRIIQHMPADEIWKRARAMGAHAREHYHPRQVFGGILAAL